jgi:polyphosphate kinase
MTASDIYLDREMSWLDFNSRVLEEAQDSSTPLLERLRFYCIFHSNLDEFFMVRVASLLQSIRQGEPKRDQAGLTPFQQLERVLERVRLLEEMSFELYAKKLSPNLAKNGIHLLSPDEIQPAQKAYLDGYFEKEIYPVLTPVAVRLFPEFPWLAGLGLNLAVSLATGKGEHPEEPLLAVVPVPGKIPGLVRVPDGDGIRMIWLTDVIRRRLPALFPGCQILESGIFRLTRDSELELDDEGRYDFVRMLESELKKRRLAQPVRVEFEADMTAGLMGGIRDALAVKESDTIAVRRPLDPKSLLALVDLPGLDKLRYPAQPPVLPAHFAQEKNIFDLVRDRDIFLHHPYDSFDPVVEFIQAAADDPDVLAIKQTLYRASGPGSPILDALVRAADKGKQVTVLIELTARFDEERNIGRARDLEEAGAHVLYGIAGLKVHAKIALVVRRELGGIRRYVHLATGNYNERTARVYTDMGLLTAADEFGSDASGFFNTITGYSEPPVFKRLIMGPLGLRERIISLIRREADWARSGQASGIMARMNSLVDPEIIRELSEASCAGVPIQMCIRGICCLRPGVPGKTENIRVVSIVDRYLEHSRAFVFHNGGSQEVFLSSADWMPRNLDRRVELMFPLVDDSAQRRVMEALQVQFADNQKARRLRPDGKYERVSAKGVDPMRAQVRLYELLKEERDRVRTTTPVRFVPIEGKDRSG